jgi:CheY-like chemotaxis protein
MYVRSNGVVVPTPEHKPKLLIVDGPDVPARELARVLGSTYDVIASEGGAPDVVISGAAGACSPQKHRSAAVLEAIGEGVCLAGPDGRIAWVNDRFKLYDDATRSRIEAVCRRAASRFSELRAGGGQEGWPGAEKFEVAAGDGSLFLEVMVSPVPRAVPVDPGATEAPTHGAVCALCWDVTASRRLQSKMEAIDRAGQELVRLDSEAIRKMHVTQRLKVLEQKIIRFAHDLLNFDHFAVRLLDQRSGKLELVMASGLPSEALELEFFAAREGSGISGYVAATGRSYLCPDVVKDRRYVMGLTNARSSLTVPLLLHDKVIGVFNVESEKPNAFTEEDRQFAEMFATHIALALHILDLLVMERCATGETVTGTVAGELSEPLADILSVTARLKDAAAGDENVKRSLERIMGDVEAIRNRVKEAASGPQTILGAERALTDLAIEPALVGKRVLIADDEPKIRQIIRDVLGSRGCVVTVCENGGVAIDRINEASEDGRGFDLVVSDIKMPDKNGYEVFSASRRLNPSTPVVLMTGFGYDPHHSIVRASQEGLQCVLFKPFQVERLLEEVRKALRVEQAAR